MYETYTEKGVKYFSLLLLMAAAIIIIPLGEKLVGYPILLAGALSLYLTEEKYAKHALLVFISIAILGITPINTDIEPVHFSLMATMLGLAVAVPYGVSRFVYKDKKVIQYLFAKHSWTKPHIGYLLLALVLSYLLLPLLMSSTGSWQNWTVHLDWQYLSILFVGTNGLGIWDELFFVVTVLALLKRHLPFWQANGVQAVLFTTFLFELGFRGWSPLVIFPFALLQGFVYKKTENLAYIVAIHLTIDFVLYLVLIHSHFNELLPIFITG